MSRIVFSRRTPLSFLLNSKFISLAKYFILRGNGTATKTACCRLVLPDSVDVPFECYWCRVRSVRLCCSCCCSFVVVAGVVVIALNICFTHAWDIVYFYSADEVCKDIRVITLVKHLDLALLFENCDLFLWFYLQLFTKFRKVSSRRFNNVFTDFNFNFPNFVFYIVPQNKLLKFAYYWLAQSSKKQAWVPRLFVSSSRSCPWGFVRRQRSGEFHYFLPSLLVLVSY